VLTVDRRTVWFYVGVPTLWFILHILGIKIKFHIWQLIYFYGKTQEVKTEKISTILSKVFIIVKTFKVFHNLLFQKPK
jgi:hypothetical protein